MARQQPSGLIPFLGAAALCAACASSQAGVGAAAGPGPDAAPGKVAEELLAADRAFAAASERTDVVSGLAPMLAADVTMPAPGGFAVGRDSVLAAFRANPANANARFTWSPVRVGVSADGRHGFTWGYGTLSAADGSTTPVKYLTYWVRGPEGWRAEVYKRGRAAAASGSEPAPAPKPPALPEKLVAPTHDSAVVAGYRASLDSAERAFSSDAQEIGLQAAFARHGSADAVNMGGGARARFVEGPDSIGAAVAEGEPATGSSVSWAPDRVIVASSGDLGVTIGTIVTNEANSTGARGKFPFFTVWRRAGPDQPWRYVAE